MEMRNKYLRTGIALLLIVLPLLVASCGKTTAPVTSGPATFSQIRADIDQLSSSVNNMSSQSAATAVQLTQIHNQLTAIENKLGIQDTSGQ